MRLPEGAVLLALCATVAMACSSPASTESAPVSATPAASTPAATPPTPAAPAAPVAEESSEVCPLPRRCDPACATASSKAGDACMPTAQELMKLLPNAAEIGRCTAACLKETQAKLCVGPATESECACTRKCKDLIPAPLLEKGKAYDTCYRKAIEAACY